MEKLNIHTCRRKLSKRDPSFFFYKDNQDITRFMYHEGTISDITVFEANQIS